MPKQHQIQQTEFGIEKFCPKCNQWKLIETSFGKKKGKSGSKLASWCKECAVNDTAEWRKRKGRWATELSGRIQRIIATLCRGNSDLRSADIREIYKRQQGKCFYTGLDMKLMSDKKNDPLIMSVDRVNSKIGYIDGNVVLCCLGINHLKNRYSAEEMYKNLKLFYEGAKNLNKL